MRISPQLLNQILSSLGLIESFWRGESGDVVCERVWWKTAEIEATTFLNDEDNDDEVVEMNPNDWGWYWDKQHSTQRLRA